MTKKQQDFEIWSGDHADITFTVLDGTSASKDLTGASAVWVLANDGVSGSLVRKTSDAASQISISGCTFTVYLVPADTSDLAGTYYHEGQVRDSASNTSTVAVGSVRINYDVA